MRKLAISAAAALCTGQAMAADMPDFLRGSVYEAPPPAIQRPYYDWEGVYVGGQVGYAENNVSFRDATKTMVSRLLRQTTVENEAHVSTWPSLQAADTRGASYGGFVGYNTQWGEIVLGAEAGYNATSLETASSDVIGRRYTTSDGVTYDGTVVSKASMRLTDYGTLRARAGYAWNWLMPYMTAGVAFGRADISRSTNVVLDMTQGGNFLGTANFADSKTQNGAMLIGYSAGLGVDIGLMPGVFLRAEYEFVQFSKIDGISPHVSTIRTAAAVKF